jgi:hypothetical protein
MFTLALDAMPFITWHLPSFNRLTIPWRWIIAHGVAANTGSTRWCKAITPRLSNDGTTEYLRAIQHHPRVTILEAPFWLGGKDEMVQACTDTIKEPCTLIEIDADEHWESRQIQGIHELFCPVPGISQPWFNCARFFFRYYVGQNLITCADNAWGQNPGEFLRAWRFRPGMKWRSHEPPCLLGVNEPALEKCASRELTRAHGLVAEHYGYAFEKQVAFKRDYYGYPSAIEGWRRLQAYKGPFPTSLKPFFPWVNGDPMVDLLHKP